MGELRFEEALKRLEEIAAQLEAEELDLDRVTELFEEGMTLATQLHRKLEETELKLKRVLASAEGFSVEDLAL